MFYRSCINSAIAILKENHFSCFGDQEGLGKLLFFPPESMGDVYIFTLNVENSMSFARMCQCRVVCMLLEM